MKKAVLFFFLLALAASHTQAQWTSLGSGITAPNRVLAQISPVNEQVMWGFTWDATFASLAFEFTRTTDGGQTWKEGTFLPFVSTDQYTFCLHGLDSMTAWLATADEKDPIGGKIYKTNDGGATWVHQSTGFTGFNETPSEIHFWNANEGFAYGATFAMNFNDQIAIYTTENGGDTWTKVDSLHMPAQLPGEGQGIYNLNGVFSVVGDSVWFGSSKNRVFRSTNRGKTWEAFATPFTTSFIPTVGFKNSKVGMAIRFNPLGIARSTDGGATWTELPVSVPTTFRGAELANVPGTPGTWLLVAGAANYMITHDNGDTWEIFDTSLEIWSTKFLSPEVGFVSGAITSPTEGGVFKWSGGPLTGLPHVAPAPAQLALAPNPAGDFLHFRLPEPGAGPLMVSLFDATGALLRTCTLPYTQALAIADLPAGAYTIKVSDGKATRVGRFVKK